jgi:hypothetical protein
MVLGDVHSAEKGYEGVREEGGERPSAFVTNNGIPFVPCCDGKRSQERIDLTRNETGEMSLSRKSS